MTNDYDLPIRLPWERTSPAHDLARSRLMITEDDVDLIGWAVLQLQDIPDLNVYDLGAGSGTTAASVLSARRENIHGTTLDISRENLDWSRKFVTQSWPVHEQMEDPFPVPGVRLVQWTDVSNCQWRWINVPSIPPYAIRPSSVHLLLIDTSHDYVATLEELAWWKRVVSLRHYVWLDDYTTYPGVKQAVDAYELGGELAVIRQQGQGILCRYV